MIWKAFLNKRVLWVFLLLVGAGVLSSRFPVFTDEVAWKWLTSRLWFDSGISIALYPHCSDSFSLKVPFLFYPARVVDSLFYSSAQMFFSLRAIGILLQCALFLGFWFLTKKMNQIYQNDAKERFLVGVSVCLFGVLPFVLCMNRPEQVLSLCLMMFVLLTLHRPEGKGQELLIGGGLAALSEVFFAQHAKALFFLPLVLICCWFARTHRKVKWIISVWVLILAFQCFSFFWQHTRCSNEFVKTALAAMMVAPIDLLTAPQETWTKLIHNGLNVTEYMNSILIHNQYAIDWLPKNYGFAKGTHVLNASIQMFFGAWVLALFLGFVGLWRERNQGQDHNRILQIAVGIGAGIGGLALFQSGKSFYESALVIPLLLILGIMTIPKKMIKVFLPLAVIIATSSAFLVAYRLWPHLSGDWSGQGPLGQQDHSLKPAHQKAIGPRLDKLADKCNLAGAGEKLHLVVDDLTYPYFMKTKEPYHAVYVLGWWGRMSIQDPEGFLKSRRSAGLISQCRWLPEQLLSKSVRDEDLCCLPAF
ncbi:MAG: hypothetical protein ACKN9V_10640 [Pseudomonadota bacterium]